jgi:flagellar basal-body rod modification protein FlgD
MEEMLNFQASTISALAVGLIGKEVSSQGDMFILGEDDLGADLSFYLEADAATIDITVMDAEGNYVDSWELNDLEAGKQSTHWDGLDYEGNQAEAGTYNFVVQAKDIEGETVSSTTFQNGMVTGISFDDGVTYLVINGEKVTLAEVVGITEQAA